MQSNNMPKMCWSSSDSSYYVANQTVIDFKVIWNAAMTSIQNYDKNDILSQTDLDKLLCDCTRTNENNMYITTK